MLRNFVAYNDAAIKAIGGEKAASGDGDLSFAQVKDKTSDLMFKLSQMKFEVCQRVFIVSHFRTVLNVGAESISRRRSGQQETG